MMAGKWVTYLSFHKHVFTSSLSLFVVDPTALKMAVVKPPASRNYEDLLTIKGYIQKLEFFRDIFSNLSLDQVDDLCR